MPIGGHRDEGVEVEAGVTLESSFGRLDGSISPLATKTNFKGAQHVKKLTFGRDKCY